MMHTTTLMRSMNLTHVQFAPKVELISLQKIKLANSLTTPLKLGEVTRQGVGENSWFKANYSHDVNIVKERIQSKLPVIIADKTDQVIFGLDFLCVNNALIDLNDQSMNIQGVKLKAEVVKAWKRTISLARVLLKTKLRIPNHTSVHIMGKLDNTLEGEVMIQPSQSIKGLLSPNFIANQEEVDMPIFLQNVSAQRVIFQKTKFLEQHNHSKDYCGIIVVRGGFMFVDFMGHPYPRIYVSSNLYLIIFIHDGYTLNTDIFF